MLHAFILFLNLDWRYHKGKKPLPLFHIYVSAETTNIYFKYFLVDIKELFYIFGLGFFKYTLYILMDSLDQLCPYTVLTKFSMCKVTNLIIIFLMFIYFGVWFVYTYITEHI